jgi:tetratricopeptide (TPR) repeat protein
MTTASKPRSICKPLVIGLLTAAGWCAAVPWGNAQVNQLRPAELPASGMIHARPISDRPVKASAEAPITSSKTAQHKLHEAFTLSKSCRTIEEYSQIVELCEQASNKTLTPEESQYSRQLTAWAYNKRGEAQSVQAAEFAAVGSEKEAAQLDRAALRDFSAAIKVDPRHWKALHNRGVSYGILGLNDEAIADFTLVTEIKPDYLDAWFNRAEVQCDARRFQAAERDYTHALDLKPEDAATYRGRGRARLNLGKTTEALADLNKALELEPEHAGALASRGQTLSRLSQWAEAAADFRAAIESDPDCAEAYRGAAWLMATCPQVKFRNAKSAVEAAEQAMALGEPQGLLDATYFDTLAAAYANAGRFPDAQRAVQQGLQIASAADAKLLTYRRTLYENRRPYREGSATASYQPASTKVRAR